MYALLRISAFLKAALEILQLSRQTGTEARTLRGAIRAFSKLGFMSPESERSAQHDMLLLDSLL